MADLAFKSFEGGQNRFLSALGGGAGFSNSALAPFLAMAQAGIVNPAVFMKENPWVTGLNTAANVAGAVSGFMNPGG
jgi:hypothetical protein